LMRLCNTNIRGGRLENFYSVQAWGYYELSEFASSLTFPLPLSLLYVMRGSACALLLGKVSISGLYTSIRGGGGFNENSIILAALNLRVTALGKVPVLRQDESLSQIRWIVILLGPVTHS
jgi:hypothetical protein